MRAIVIGAALLAASAGMAEADQAAKVRVVRDVQYVVDASYPDASGKLDLYLPDGRANVPVIVSYYGGGLTAGDKAEQAFVGQRFAAAGIATAVVNYRLSPAVTHPAHVEDAAASFAWVKRHIAEYGGNADQVFAIGHSAGAYLVALLATDERYLAAHALTLRDLRGVVPVSAFYWVEKPGVAPDRDKRIWGTDRQTWIDASPAHHLSARVPPMLVLYADGDDAWRRQQNVDAVAALTAAGAPRVEIAMLPGRTHLSIWNRLAEPDDEAARRIVQFVRSTAGLGSR